MLSPTLVFQRRSENAINVANLTGNFIENRRVARTTAATCHVHGLRNGLHCRVCSNYSQVSVELTISLR